MTRIVSLTLTRAEGRQSPSSYIVLLRVASTYLSQLLESGWRQSQRHRRLFHSSCCDEKMVMAMRHHFTRYKYILTYALMRMQTQGSHRLSSEATTLIFQPFASLHHQQSTSISIKLISCVHALQSINVPYFQFFRNIIKVSLFPIPIMSSADIK